MQCLLGPAKPACDSSFCQSNARLAWLYRKICALQVNLVTSLLQSKGMLSLQLSRLCSKDNNSLKGIIGQLCSCLCSSKGFAPRALQAHDLETSAAMTSTGHDKGCHDILNI